MLNLSVGKFFIAVFAMLLSFSSVLAQSEITQTNNRRQDNQVRTVTIPISITSRQEMKDRQFGEFVEAGDIIVREDGENQLILSIRSTSNTPLALAILVQEGISSSFNLELERLADFIRRLPRGSRVMVAYLRGGSIQVRQKFTEDLEKAAKSLRIVSGNSAFSSDPFEGVSEAVERFDAQPIGRRAVLLISDGLDSSGGIGIFSSIQSPVLERAIFKAQRKGVAIYSFYTPDGSAERSNSGVALSAQGALNRLSEETGGRGFFQGTSAPVSFDPFFRSLSLALNRQFALTYLSTHMKKGYHKIEVTSTNPQVRVEHPKGYFYR